MQDPSAGVAARHRASGPDQTPDLTLGPTPGPTPDRASAEDHADAVTDLGRAAIGFRGRISRVSPPENNPSLDPEELERRLLELGFVEGAAVEVLHHGLFGRDPIAVRVAGTTVALRRREASALLVTAVPDGSGAAA